MKDKELIQKAYKALNEPRNSIFRQDNKNAISASYNGQIAALGVTIALNGLLPALAIYYQDTENSDKCNRRKILDLIASMLKKDASGKDLLEDALEKKDEDLQILKKEIIACSIALKQVVRTYKLIKDEDE